MASERQVNLMEMPSGLKISQQFTSVEFMFASEEDAEKFYICVSESFRMGTPFTIRPDKSEARHGG